jgi:hypothetical protein
MTGGKEAERTAAVDMKWESKKEVTKKALKRQNGLPLTVSHGLSLARIALKKTKIGNL